jgi:hypothetical protein
MKPDTVRVPRAELVRLEAFLTAAVRRLAATPGVDSQQLAEEGEAVLLDLCAEWARDDTRKALWGEAGRPALPPAAKAGKA